MSSTTEESFGFEASTSSNAVAISSGVVMAASFSPSAAAKVAPKVPAPRVAFPNPVILSAAVTADATPPGVTAKSVADGF